MRIGLRFFLILIFSYALLAQDPPQTEPDVLIFTNGEKLIGHLVRSDGDSVVFHSDSVGEVTVPWAKIQDVQSKQNFAVIEKQMKLRKGEATSKIPQGTLSLEGENLIVKTPEGQQRTLPVTETNHVIDQATFERSVLHNAGIFQNWRGTITAGLSIVQATQTNRTYTGAVNIMRADPLEIWLDRRQRTMVNLNTSYGTLTQPNTPRLRTEILHADAEHDVYFTTRLFGFGQMAFDHNFSQGLDLAQSYSSGIGWTVIKRDTSELNLKVSAGYLKQQFADPTQNQNLIGSIFSENFMHKFPRMTLVQRLTVTPAWNNLNAYSGTGDITLNIPVYRKLMFTFGVMNTFINNPSPGFRKNSFQATTGITYSLQ